MGLIHHKPLVAYGNLQSLNMLKQSSKQLLNAERCIQLNRQPDVFSLNAKILLDWVCVLFKWIIAQF